MIINGLPVVSGWVAVPSFGAITGELECSSAIDTGQALINGGQLVATVTETQSYANRCYIKLIGGAGGLSTEIDSESFRNVTVGAILSSVLGKAGETQSPAISASILTQQLPFWTSTQGQAGAQLGALASALDIEWRTLMDGTIWIGSGVPVGTSFEEPIILDYSPNLGELVYAGEFAVPVGAAIAAGTSQRVVVDIGGNARTTVWVLS